MRRAAAVAGATALASGVIAAVVLLGRDTTALVSPPEAVAESFVSDLVARRYDLAMRYVDRTSGVSVTTVRLGADALRREAGDAAPNDVDGDQAVIDGDRATAIVTIRSPGRTVVLLVEMRRAADGVWRVTGWEKRS
jgi:hypothetical protein